MDGRGIGQLGMCRREEGGEELEPALTWFLFHISPAPLTPEGGLSVILVQHLGHVIIRPQI